MMMEEMARVVNDSTSQMPSDQGCIKLGNPLPALVATRFWQV